MYETIIDYAKKYADVPFEEMPLNEVDSLVLSQFAYMKLAGIVPSEKDEKSITLEEIQNHPDFDKLFVDFRFAERNRALFEAMCSGRRFGSMKICNHVDILEEEWQMQFSATTFIFSDGKFYIAFRGTDETLVGWKEDFNMSFSQSVPCQEYSAKYLNRISGKMAGKYYVGGHSKGGNLAVYAAMNCLRSERERIIRVFDHDGPGFREDVLTGFDQEGISEKIFRTLPHSSIVGMLFSSADSHYDVVESRGLNIQQHDPYNWRVQGDSFYKVKDIYKSRKFADGTVNRWIESMNDEQRETFVETLYAVLEGSEAKTLLEIIKDPFKKIDGVVKTAKNLDEETKEILKETVQLLADALVEEINEKVLTLN